MNRDSVDIIDRSGRILTYMIRVLGMGDVMGMMWGVKIAIEGLPFSWSPLICDKLLHTFNNWVPSAIPNKFIQVGREYDHNCVVAVGEFGDGTLARFMERMDAFVKKYNGKAVLDANDIGKKIISVVEANSSSEVTALNAFRFVAAPAFKTYCVGEDIQGVSVDYALPKNGGTIPPLTKDAAKPLKRMRYSHFGCNVVHEDIAYALGVDTHKEKMAFKNTVEDEGGKLPAEHGHGTEYNAPTDTKKRWMKMDPLNVMNPGVGGLSSLPKYASKREQGNVL
jgi:D-lactate dehydrogenase